MVQNVLLAMAMLLATACAGQQKQTTANLPTTTHQCGIHDICVSWQPVTTDTGICIEGTVVNNRQLKPYEPLELTAELLDDQGKVLAKGSRHFAESFTGPEDFRIEIPMDTGKAPKCLKFTYSNEKGGNRYWLKYF
ncbi:hypothetical protein [Geotalea sp. SG265]|uniref:hypothetical protein n=1 Tax=Geotalea sp. SG265 TaxID=2922867 RepID=UPI001FAF3750|nr:hypothetical protein [Geotalea sp. SG265]